MGEYTAFPRSDLRALLQLAQSRMVPGGAEPPPEIPTIFAGGLARHSVSGRMFDTINPSTETVAARVSRGNTDDAKIAAESARSSFEGSWRHMTPEERGGLLSHLAAALEANAESFAALETLDTGKPIGSSRGDISGAIATLRYNAGAADKMEGITVPLGNGFVDFTELEPLGVTTHITPWNFPLGMAVRSVAPALAAGCTTIIKPAEQSPLTTVAFAELAACVGFPPGAVNVVTGFGEEAGVALVEHPLVDGVTFTGSVETGRLVGASAGRAIKPVVLELGGKNPMLVFDDADTGRAVDSAMEGAFDNCGQVCSSVSRLLLQRGIRDEFLSRFLHRARKLKVAPGIEDADLGPLISEAHFGKVAGHIEDAIQKGAKLLLGGNSSGRKRKGYFVGPTVFDEVDPASALVREETFGPVVAVSAFTDEDEAIRIANGLSYGLAAGVHTSCMDRAFRVARKLDAGTVWINGWFIGGVQAPTGGVKDSGIGRERGLEGVRNYLRIKNIGIAIAGNATG